MEAVLLSLTPSFVARAEKNDPRLGALLQALKADIGRPLTAHSVSTVQLKSLSNSRPCTKGVAKASAAQAAENASPPSSRTWCRVSSAVTG